ncbi:uncharacterized protein LOC124825341 [Vigna umbellata]|uniref:uncharacterized protein LOC124825341 n=1 Tax=Vigna umbellata TaxID=87088 RepID=UPI001F5EBF17|nr:uncharacterized protein LOC124825341 [Vigna umbellata]
MQDEDGNTALALAAIYGDINIARRFVNAEGGEELLAIQNKEGEIPLLMAANSGRKRMTRYLYLRTSSHVIDQQSSHNRVLLLERCIQAHIFDVALKLLKSYEELPIESLPILHQLARMTSAHLQPSLWQTIVYSLKNGKIFLFFLPNSNIQEESTIMDSCGLKSQNRERVLGHKNEFLQILWYYKDIISMFNSSQLREALVYDAMLEAAKHGNVEFINDMREANHDVLRAMDNHGRDIFSYAVLHRKHNVFQLMHTLCGNKDIISYTTDMFDNNLLHLAAHLGPLSDLNLRPGAALQMQREIQWFKVHSSSLVFSLSSAIYSPCIH